jgi:hypothetical protein
VSAQQTQLPGGICAKKKKPAGASRWASFSALLVAAVMEVLQV